MCDIKFEYYVVELCHSTCQLLTAMKWELLIFLNLKKYILFHNNYTNLCREDYRSSVNISNYQ